MQINCLVCKPQSDELILRPAYQLRIQKEKSVSLRSIFALIATRGGNKKNNESASPAVRLH